MFKIFFLISLISNISLILASPVPETQTFIKGYFPQPNNENSYIYRLPDNVVPESYDLRIVPDLDKFTFTGQVKIAINIKFSTNVILLHSKDLDIKKCSVLKESEVTDTLCSPDVINELLVVKIEKKIKFNTKCVLQIDFHGTIRKDMTGFYATSYMHDGVKKWAAVTQMEPTSARLVFPCFDEPKYRAAFSISIARFSNEKAVSNMPLESTSNQDPKVNNRVWDKFKTTPPMSTYLVSFMVSTFTYKTESNGILRIHSRENAIGYTSYALKQSIKLIPNMEEFVSVDYELPKLDVVAIPDFSAGAMENWGMTTYRERFVILDEPSASEAHKLEVTRVIAHEFAHQWFGDFVTIAWWDNLWLNEGFATYFEWFITHRIEPSWNVDEIFVLEIVQKSLWGELGVNRAMTSPVQKKSDPHAVFDVISYYKGASIIRMFEHIVTTPSFRSALNSYLSEGHSTHKGTVVPKNLFEAFEFQASKDSPKLPPHITISDVMKTWTENVGYPLITIKRCTHHQHVHITQAPYKSAKAGTVLSDSGWFVPLTCTTKSEASFKDTTPSLWLLPNKPVTIKNVPVENWILCNLQQSGYYRVNYDSLGWDLLIKQLKEDPNKIPKLNRAALVDDSFSLAVDNVIQMKIPLELIGYLEKETELIPWLSAINNLERIYSKLCNAKSFARVEAFLKKLIDIAYNRFGFDIQPLDSHVTKIVKPKILEFANRMGHIKSIESALKHYENNVKDITKVQPDLKKVVYCSVLRYSDKPQEVFDNLWSNYLKTEISYDANQILTVLGCAKDEVVINKILHKVMYPNPEEIREQDRYFFVRSVFSYTEIITTGIKFLLQKVPNLSQLNNDEIGKLKTLFSQISNNIKTKEQAELLKTLVVEFEKLDQTKFSSFTELAKSTYPESIKNIKSNEDAARAIGQILDQIEKSQKTDEKPSSAGSILISSWLGLTFASFLSFNSLFIRFL